MDDFHPALETARAYAQKGDPVAMVRIHVRLDLEHDPGELRLAWRNRARGGGANLRRRGDLEEEIKQIILPDIVERAAENHGRLLGGSITPAGARMSGMLLEADVAAE